MSDLWDVDALIGRDRGHVSTWFFLLLEATPQAFPSSPHTPRSLLAMSLHRRLRCSPPFRIVQVISMVLLCVAMSPWARSNALERPFLTTPFASRSAQISGLHRRRCPPIAILHCLLSIYVSSCADHARVVSFCRPVEQLSVDPLRVRIRAVVGHLSMVPTAPPPQHLPIRLYRFRTSSLAPSCILGMSFIMQVHALAPLASPCRLLPWWLGFLSDFADIFMRIGFGRLPAVPICLQVLFCSPHHLWPFSLRICRCLHCVLARHKRMCRTVPSCCYRGQ